jgi:poly-gamma-glutamate synthesis protein (capsule biosynthesis protein)
VIATDQAIRFGRRAGRVALLVCLAWLIRPASRPGATLALLGDVMLGRGVAAVGAAPADVMEVLEPALASADLALANLESPLTSAPSEVSSGYNLCAPPEQVQVLKAAGLDLVSLANNHRLDCGEQGLEDTRRSLVEAGVQPIGPELTPVYRQVDSFHLAFIALDDVSRPVSLTSAIESVAEARASGAFVVVSIHWGNEYQPAPNARQRDIAGALVEAGAGLVWGHHPHVVQPVERVACAYPQGCLVLYSLGNAVFDQGGLADTRRSAAVLVDLDDRGVFAARAIPFSIDVRRGRLAAASPADASAVIRRLGPEVVEATNAADH